IGHTNLSPPFTGFNHTFQPFFNRGLALISDEANQDNCKDSPRTVWLVDIRNESNPVVIGTAPYPPNDGERCKAGGRFGAHNLQPNFPDSTSRRLKNTAVASWFNGGVRIFHIADGPTGVPDAPPHLDEIGYYIPGTIAGNPGGIPQINHAI